MNLDEDLASEEFLKLCSQLAGFFRNQHQREKEGLPLHASCTRTGTLLRVIRSYGYKMDPGIDLIATSPTEQLAHLQISCDPTRLGRWIAQLKGIVSFNVQFPGFCIYHSPRDGTQLEVNFKDWRGPTLHSSRQSVDLSLSDPFTFAHFTISGRNLWIVSPKLRSASLEQTPVRPDTTMSPEDIHASSSRLLLDIL